MILKAEIAVDRNAYVALMACWDWYANGALDIEIAPAFTACKCRGNHKGMIGESRYAGRGLKPQKCGKGIIAIRFICAGDPLLNG